MMREIFIQNGPPLRDMDFQRYPKEAISFAVVRACQCRVQEGHTLLLLSDTLKSKINMDPLPKTSGMVHFYGKEGS